MTSDELLFFDNSPDALPLYECLISKLESFAGEMSIQVKKTQISFYNTHMFGCVSFTRVKRKAEMPRVFITVTFGLDHPKQSDRIAVCTEAAPNRWTHHVVIGDESEIDDELLGWMKEAYDFSNRKRK